MIIFTNILVPNPFIHIKSVHIHTSIIIVIFIVTAICWSILHSESLVLFFFNCCFVGVFSYNSRACSYNSMMFLRFFEVRIVEVRNVFRFLIFEFLHWYLVMIKRTVFHDYHPHESNYCKWWLSVFKVIFIYAKNFCDFINCCIPVVLFWKHCCLSSN